MRFLSRRLAALALLAIAAPAIAQTEPPRPEHVIAQPNWIQKPTGEQLSDYYPKVAADTGVSGFAMITCRVTSRGGLFACRVYRETPGGYGFGEAALALSPYFRMTPKTIDGQPVEGGVVTVPIVFDNPEERLGDSAFVATPVDAAGARRATGPLMTCPGGVGRCEAHSLKWLRQPDGATTRRLVLEIAPRTGSTHVLCVGGPDGALRDCQVVGDTSKPAMTVMAAALPNLRAAERTEDGVPTAGAMILIQFMWEELYTKITRRLGR